MTCIVGLIQENNGGNNKIYIGGDSIAANIGTYKIGIRNQPKVFKNKNMLFGFTSSFRMGQLLEHSLHIPLHDPEIADMRYLVTTWVDAVRECFKKGGYMEIDKTQESGGTFLLGYKNKLYTIFDNFQIAEDRDSFSAIGCGESYALGALHALQDDIIKTPEEKINIAILAAARFSGFVSPPITILSI